MAVDRGYGSGKPRSAANSRNRRRAAAGQLSKSKKGAAATIKSQRAKLAASPLGQLADTVLGFALPVGKVKAASRALRATGRVTAGAGASMLEARVISKLAGREAGKRIAESNSYSMSKPSSFAGGRLGNKSMSQYIENALKIGKENRVTSQGVFPLIKGSKRRGGR